MQDLTLTLVQESLVWENPEANRTHLAATLATIGSTDLVMLPEMFTTGFSTASTAQAESMQGPTVEWMRMQANRHGFALTGSVKILDDGRCFNRMIFVEPDGNLHCYDKRHLFRMAGEHERYTAGRERVVVNYRGWRLLLQVCYDLRFPVFSRNRNDYDLALYVANWPAARRHPWRTLLPARAVENLAYCAGVNRIGEDGNGIAYSGDSLLIDFKGEILADLGSEPGVVTRRLSAESLQAFREKFPAHLDADEFSLGPPAAPA